MNNIPQDAALIIIDVQKTFDEPTWGERNNHQVEENIAVLRSGALGPSRASALSSRRRDSTRRRCCLFRRYAPVSPVMAF